MAGDQGHRHRASCPCPLRSPTTINREASAHLCKRVGMIKIGVAILARLNEVEAYRAACAREQKRRWR
jgi:hypothetical protein